MTKEYVVNNLMRFDNSISAFGEIDRLEIDEGDQLPIFVAKAFSEFSDEDDKCIMPKRYDSYVIGIYIRNHFEYLHNDGDFRPVC